MLIRTERTVTSCAWSFLRPYLYTVRVTIFLLQSCWASYGNKLQTDGEKILLHHSESCSKIWELGAISDNELLLDDAITDLMTVNEQTHELLVSGTRNGRSSEDMKTRFLSSNQIFRTSKSVGPYVQRALTRTHAAISEACDSRLPAQRRFQDHHHEEDTQRDHL
jgi:hypothetical protein